MPAHLPPVLGDVGSETTSLISIGLGADAGSGPPSQLSQLPSQTQTPILVREPAFDPSRAPSSENGDR